MKDKIYETSFFFVFIAGMKKQQEIIRDKTRKCNSSKVVLELALALKDVPISGELGAKLKWVICVKDRRFSHSRLEASQKAWKKETESLASKIYFKLSFNLLLLIKFHRN